MNLVFQDLYELWRNALAGLRLDDQEQPPPRPLVSRRALFGSLCFGPDQPMNPRYGPRMQHRGGRGRWT